jgi:hypothetical protein
MVASSVAQICEIAAGSWGQPASVASGHAIRDVLLFLVLDTLINLVPMYRYLLRRGYPDADLPAIDAQYRYHYVVIDADGFACATGQN